MNPLDLTPPTEKVALVIRAGTPLGQAIALGLAAAGWDVAIHDDQTPQVVQELASSIRNLGRRSALLYANLNDEGQTTEIIADCAQKLGLPTCLVYQATYHQNEATTFNYALLDAHVRMNSSVPILLAHTLHQAKLAANQSTANRSVIISIFEKKRDDCLDKYSVTSSLSSTLSQAPLQAAIPLLARTLAMTLRVVGIAIEEKPSSLSNTITPHANLDGITKLISNANVKNTSSTDHDIANTVCFLATAQAITGTILVADHGHHLLVTNPMRGSHTQPSNNASLTNP